MSIRSGYEPVQVFPPQRDDDKKDIFSLLLLTLSLTVMSSIPILLTILGSDFLGVFSFCQSQKIIETTMKILVCLAALTANAASAAHFGGYAAFAAIAPGDKIPPVDMHRGFPPEFINMAGMLCH